MVKRDDNNAAIFNFFSLDKAIGPWLENVL
jgi:hypothetical protein